MNQQLEKNYLKFEKIERNIHLRAENRRGNACFLSV